jgi:hypothetical protein
VGLGKRRFHCAKPKFSWKNRGSAKKIQLSEKKPLHRPAPGRKYPLTEAAATLQRQKQRTGRAGGAKSKRRSGSVLCSTLFEIAGY